jgi:hypothetical protein
LTPAQLLWRLPGPPERALRARLAEKDEQTRLLRARLAEAQRKEFECSVCEHAQVDCALVPCGHTFCVDCVRRWQRAGAARGDMRCPMCNAVAQVVQPCILS